MASPLELLLAARHLPRQRRVIAALLDTGARSVWRSRKGAAVQPPLALPGQELTERVTAPAPALVRDYLRHLGAAAEAYRHPATVPPHLFPQWTFPIAARVLRELHYPLTRILNAGCRLEVNAPVPASAPLTVRAQLMNVEDDGRRALLHQRVVTGTPVAPNAVVADLYAVARLPSKGEPDRAGDGRHGPYNGKGTAAAAPNEGRETAIVPPRARELARMRFEGRAGLVFALLTGDLNPVHWAGAYARAAGFATPILHGFAMMARVYEGLARALFAGRADSIRVLDVRFKRPLVLGHGREIGLYQDDNVSRTIYLADAPGVRPYLVGQFTPEQSASVARSAPSREEAATRPALSIQSEPRKEMKGENHA